MRSFLLPPTRYDVSTDRDHLNMYKVEEVKSNYRNMLRSLFIEAQQEIYSTLFTLCLPSSEKKSFFSRLICLSPGCLYSYMLFGLASDSSPLDFDFPHMLLCWLEIIFAASSAARLIFDFVTFNFLCFFLLFSFSPLGARAQPVILFCLSVRAHIRSPRRRRRCLLAPPLEVSQ